MTQQVSKSQKSHGQTSPWEFISREGIRNNTLKSTEQNKVVKITDLMRIPQSGSDRTTEVSNATEKGQISNKVVLESELNKSEQDFIIENGYLIGKLVELNLEEKSFSIKLINKSFITAKYNMNFKNILKKNMENLIYIHGSIIYKNETPVSISNVDILEKFKFSDIIVDNFKYKGKILKISPPIKFKTEKDKENNLVCASGDFDIIVFAEARETLMNEIEEALIMLWTEYAEEEDDALAPKAIDLANKLRMRISISENGPQCL